MNIETMSKLIQDIAIAEVFRYDDDIWIKTNASHNDAGFQCVDLRVGSLVYLKQGTKVTQVQACVYLYT